MPTFRIYTIGAYGRFMGTEDVECTRSRGHPKAKAQQAADGRDVEVRERGRFITRLAAQLSTKKK